MNKKISFLTGILLLLSIISNAQNSIKVKLDDKFKGPYSGRLIVYTMRDTTKRFGQSNEDEPAFAMEVKNWKKGQVQEITSSAHSFVKNLSQLENGYYKLVAILDTNKSERATSAPGNLYTKAEMVWKATGNKADAAVLTLTDEFKAPLFKGNDTLREVVFKSARLSKFHNKSIFMKAAVVLPSSYKNNPTRMYPVVYIIPGWGGTHYNAQAKGQQQTYGVGTGSQEKIYVFLNPDTQSPFGLHAFVDSRVNGPWGEALVKELMPYIAKNYQTTFDPKMTFLTGQSTGGYGTVWLLLHYPEYFGGAWATAPDPVDFSDFTDANIYTSANFFKNADGKDKGMYKVNGVYVTTMRRFKEKEDLEGDGGQFQAFNAEFGILGKDNKPARLFDSAGNIDHKVAATWKPYDMALYVQENWDKIKANAAGKLRIFVGADDNFYLNQSVAAFDAKIKKVNAAIHVEIIPGATHFTIRTPAFVQKMQSEMDAIIKGGK